MGNKYIVGIDEGSQSAKITIFDLEGNIVCEGKEDLKPNHLAEPGIVEHPGDNLWEALGIACKKAMTNFKEDPKDIIGIGVGVIRCCRVLMKADGTLAAPVISWMDERVSRPYENTNPEVAYVTSLSGYISSRLTGELKDNVANYFGQWPVDYNTWQWSKDEEVIKQYNIPREMLFDVQMPGTILGYITKDAFEMTGLPVGIPVVSTTSDKAVEGLGAGLIHDNSAVVSLGTYITCMVTGKELPKDPQAFWAIMSSIPEKFLYEGYGVRRGMWTVSWFRDLMGSGLVERAKAQGMSPEELLNKEAEERVPVGSDGLMTILDWLANPWEPYKRGIMIGFGAHMDEAFMYRSILEGIAYTVRNNCIAMCDELGKPLKEVIISGGGSNSDLFMQIFADIFNLPAKRNVVNGSASVGAAINTAVAVGAYADYEEAVGKMVKVKDTFYPIEK
ncbi:MAG: FGGY-family carbohydrate kinase, partial [Hungatella sp.]